MCRRGTVADGLRSGLTTEPSIFEECDRRERAWDQPFADQRGRMVHLLKYLSHDHACRTRSQGVGSHRKMVTVVETFGTVYPIGSIIWWYVA